MRRREFIKVVIGGGAATWSVAALAQQSAVPVIGFLHIASPGAYVHVVAAFRRGLMENDLVEGRNITVEYRWGEGQLDRMPSLLPICWTTSRP
jgi:putative ABC transport system substrate-binding protein